MRDTAPIRGVSRLAKIGFVPTSQRLGHWVNALAGFTDATRNADARALVIRALATVEGRAHKLDPTIHTVAAFQRYSSRLIQTLMKSDLSYASLARTYRAIKPMRDSVTDLPLSHAQLAFGDRQLGAAEALALRHR